MDSARYRRLYGTASLLIVAIAFVVPSSGCVGFLVNIFYPGQIIPPAFDGLEGHRVAIVCVTSSSAFGPSDIAMELPQKVGDILRKNIEDIEVVEQQEIESWIDNHGWNEIDVRKIGRGVDAELLIAIHLDSMSLHDGQTLYRGRAEVEVTVYDMMTKQESEAWSSDLVPIVYPRTTGIHITDASPRAFQRKYIAVLAREIAKNFHSYDLKEDIAADTPF